MVQWKQKFGYLCLGRFWPLVVVAISDRLSYRKNWAFCGSVGEKRLFLHLNQKSLRAVQEKGKVISIYHDYTHTNFQHPLFFCFGKSCALYVRKYGNFNLHCTSHTWITCFAKLDHYHFSHFRRMETGITTWKMTYSGSQKVSGRARATSQPPVSRALCLLTKSKAAYLFSVHDNTTYSMIPGLAS